MRILLAHNYYQQPGGEDRVFAAEAALLARHGHDVELYRTHNDRVQELARISLAAKTVWNQSSYHELRAILRRRRPDVCHFHNTFPLISPAAFYAARAERIPVVLTLHNFRLLCPGATFLRQGAVCEDCKTKVWKWPAVVHRCYRGDRAASATVALMLLAHRLIGTWTNAVDCYIALTDLARERFLQGGIAPHRVVVKPNFIHPDPGFSSSRSGHMLFAGRLSPEKGIATLLAAWELLDAPIPLRIAGDGPMAGEVKRAAAQDARIQWLGHLGSDQLMLEMKKACCLVVPSIWFEGGLPLTILEALATGLPVLTSRIGAMAELSGPEDGLLHFEPGNAAELAARVFACWQDPSHMQTLGVRARTRFEKSYTAEENLRQLLRIYEAAAGFSAVPQLEATA